jgi:hypothetical protein
MQLSCQLTHDVATCKHLIVQPDVACYATARTQVTAATADTLVANPRNVTDS